LKHSKLAAAPASTGAPPAPSVKATSAQRSMRPLAKRSASAFWSAARMLIA
jgi:hypothetical protein